MSEFVAQVPLIEQAAASLRQSGRFETDVSGQDVEVIMKSVMEDMLTQSNQVRASIENLSVRVRDDKGQVRGSVNVQSPVKATISINARLGNSNNTGRLQLEELKIDKKAGFMAKAALSAANVDGKVKQTLQDPNRTFFDTLEKQLQQRGVSLKDANLQFRESTLNIQLQGQ